MGKDNITRDVRMSSKAIALMKGGPKIPPKRFPHIILICGIIPVIGRNHIIKHNRSGNKVGRNGG